MVRTIRISTLLGTPLVWLCALLLGVTASGIGGNDAASAQSDNEEIMRLFQSGLREFRQGYYRENEPGHGPGALHYFNLVMRRVSQLDDPDVIANTCSAMIREAERATVIRMFRNRHPDLGVRGEIRGFAEWLMGTQDPNVPIERNPQDIVQALHRAMRSPDATERLRWWEVIRQRYGEYAVPEIHRMYLHSGNEQMMGRAVQGLTMMGRQVVMPLIELMDSNDTWDRIHAAMVLGNLADSRSVPVLVEHFQSRAERDDVKQECRLALEKILGPVGSEADLAPAKEHYYTLALRYYHQMPELISGRTDQFVVWRWVPVNPDDYSEGGHLDYDHRIPVWAYMDIYAEEACLDALWLDPDFASAWDLLVAVNLRQYLEARAREQYATPDEMDEFQGVFNRAHRGVVLGAPAGQEALYRVISRCIADRLPELAVAAMEKLQEVGDVTYIPTNDDYNAATGRIESPGAPLIEALQNEDRRVRYAAAQALFILSPNAPFANIELARNLVIQGIGESSTRNVLVITNDRNLRNNLRQIMETLGYYTYFAETPREGLIRALNFPADDMILLDARIANQPVRVMRTQANQDVRAQDLERRETIFDVLQDDFRTQDIPIVLMADLETENEAYIRDVFSDGFTQGRIHDQILNTHQDGEGINPVEAQIGIFEPIWQQRRDDSGERANDIAIKCAGAIRAWNPDLAPPNFFNAVIEALVARVNTASTPTPVKVAMLETLEYFCKAKNEDKYPVVFWNNKVIPNLLPVLVSPAEQDPPIVKAKACLVLAAVYRNRDGAAWTPTDYNPRLDQVRSAEENPFWALFNILDYDPDPGNVDDDARRQWRADVEAVRENAGVAMGCAPLNLAERDYIYRYKRINRKVAINYEAPGVGD